MMRLRVLFLVEAVLAGFALVGPTLSNVAQAQDTPIAVTYDYQKTFRPLAMNVAIDDALKDPAFTRKAKPDSGTLVLSVPRGWEYTDHRRKDHVRFMLVFARNGGKVGESEEVCPVAPPYNCIAQIVSDIKSAAAIAAR